jgi:hypothetical protein
MRLERGYSVVAYIGVWCGVSKGRKMAKDCPPCGQPPLKRPQSCFRVGCLYGIEGKGMAGPNDILGCLWPPLTMRPWWLISYKFMIYHAVKKESSLMTPKIIKDVFST